LANGSQWFGPPSCHRTYAGLGAPASDLMFVLVIRFSTVSGLHINLCRCHRRARSFRYAAGGDAGDVLWAAFRPGPVSWPQSAA
jgi:hypothetical protein